MVQFNLLPDVKIQYLKAKRQKHIMVLISSLAIVASLVVLLIMISTVKVLQKKHISDLNKDIASASKELDGTKDLTKILTIQNQLKELPNLHEQKPAASRLFSYLSQTAPSQASISRLSVSFEMNTITIDGSAGDLSVVNTFTDTLKFTRYSIDGAEATKNAFSDVVLSSFSRDSKTATYSITAKFDPVIFDGTTEPKLVVPNIVTTRSEVEQPTALFQKSKTGN
jgi:hypothetical protein